MRAVASLVLAMSVLLMSRPADACTPLGNWEHELDRAYTADRVAPSAPLVTLGDVERPYPHPPSSGGCNSGAYVELLVSANDDQAPVEQLGYDVRILDTYTPLADEQRIVRGYGQSLFVRFSGFYPDTGDFDLNVEVRAMDLNGNSSEPTLFSTFIDLPEVPPDDDGGCSAGGASPGWLALAALALVRRRRR